MTARRCQIGYAKRKGTGFWAVFTRLLVYVPFQAFLSELLEWAKKLDRAWPALEGEAKKAKM